MRLPDRLVQAIKGLVVAAVLDGVMDAADARLILAVFSND